MTSHEDPLVFAYLFPCLGMPDTSPHSSLRERLHVGQKKRNTWKKIWGLRLYSIIMQAISDSIVLKWIGAILRLFG